MVALEGIYRQVKRFGLDNSVCMCQMVYTHTCNRGYTRWGPPLHVHYLLVFVVSVVCTAHMCIVCHALLVFTLVSL